MTPLFVLLVSIALLVAISFGLQKRYASSLVPRKVLHIGAISLCGVSVYVVPDLDVLLVTTLLALPALTVAVALGAFMDRSQNRKSWGIVYFALVFLLLQVLFAETQPELVFYPMAVLAVADGLATLLGAPFGKKTYRLGGDVRSYFGSVIFFSSALVVLGFAHFISGAEGLPSMFGWVTLAFIALFLTLTEAVSSKGRDNIWIPLACAYWLIIGSLDAVWVTFGTITIAILAYAAWRRNWLNAGGAATAALMGFTLLLSPDVRLLLPAFVFFAIGTGWSLLPLPEKRAKIKGPGRSKAQVLANGGLPVLALMLYFSTGLEALLWGYIAGMSAALSDTTSSELGTRLSSKSYAVLGGRSISPGASGGISLQGTLSGLLIAYLIPAVLWFTGHISPGTVLLMGSIAFSANIVDSILGQWMQRKYVMPDGSWHDEASGYEGGIPSGWRFMTNDMVNAFSSAFAVLMACIMYYL